MHNLVKTVDKVIERNDRSLIERREKQQASVMAAQLILREWIRWQRGEREPLTVEEASQLIFSEFEAVPHL